jgi:hypothetical protein
MSWDYNDLTGEPMWTEDAAFGDSNSPVPYGAEALQEEINFTPEESAAASTVAPPPVVQEVGVGESASQTAFNPDTFQSLETKGRTGIDKQNAKAFNAATDQANELATGFNDAAAKTKSATQELGNLEAQKTAASAAFTGELAGRQAQLATESAAEYEIAMQKTRQYASDYEVQLKQLSQMGVNPGRLYSNMTTGQKGTALVAAFVTDFLGTKGIKTSAMDIINRGIDQDIDAQVTAINNKRTVADGFARLWGMQREQSQSDYEAKMRMKGMMLESFKTEVAGKLGQFDSDIARAKIPLALAQVDENLAKVKVDLIKFRNDQFNQDANRNVQIRGQNVQASIASASRAHDLKLKQMELDAKKGSSPFDPSLFVRDSQGNVINQAPDKESRAKSQEKIVGYETHVRKLQGLTEALREVGKTYNGPMNKLFLNGLEAKYKSQYHDVLSSFIKATSGTAAGEPEVKRLEQVYPFADFATGLFAGGDPVKSIEAVYADRGMSTIEDLKSQAYSGGIPVDPDTAAKFKGGVTPGSLEVTNARGIDLGKISKGETGAAPSDVDDIIGRIDSGKRDEPVKADDDLINVAVDFYSTQGGRLETNQFGETALNHAEAVRDGAREKGMPVGPPIEKMIPDWFDAMDTLREKAVSQETSEAEYNKIVEYFAKQASEDRDSMVPWDTRKQNEQSAAAEYFLNEIINARK